MIRLATMRYAMLEPLRRPPQFFERAVAAHFFFKRAELEQQATQWVAEAKAAAAFESTLEQQHKAAVAAHKALHDGEFAAWLAAQPHEAAAAAAAAPQAAKPYHAYRGGQYSPPAPFKGYKESMAVKAAAADVAKAAAKHGQWHADTSSHNVFAGGIHGMPKLSTAAYAPDASSAGAGAAAYAAHHGTTGYVALAAAMDAALAELKVELAKVKAPSAS